MTDNTLKKKCRQYNVEYLKYGFISSPNNKQLPMCLLCQKVFTNEAMKPSRLSEHFKKIHPGNEKKPLSYFQTLRNKFENRNTISFFATKQSQKNDDGLICSYNISKMIAKSGKPHIIGEQLILPAIEEVLRTVVHHASPSTITKAIPLSNNTVQRRIDEMASNIEETLCGILKTQKFGLQLDESTLPGNEALLLAYARFIKDENVAQELLFAKELETDTRGVSIFNVVNQFFKDKNIPMNNIVACATDGAPALTGKYKGFLACLKKAAPCVFTVHCVIHRQHLVARNLSEQLHKSLNAVIKSVNRIKSQPLNSRMFGQLCNSNDEEFDRLLLHTEVRWLSKGNCLKRFYSLFKSVVQSLNENNCDELSDYLLAHKRDIAYLVDLFTIFNDLNLQLQGSNLNLIQASSKICTFINKLILFKNNIGRRNLTQFQTLNELESIENDNCDGSNLSDDHLLIYCDHLETLHKDMSCRYQDIINMKVPDWFLQPFTDSCMNETDIEIQEELIALKNDFELKPLFKQSYQQFWLQKEIPERYPKLWEEVKIYFIAFPTTYLAEQGFSVVTQLLTKQRNRLQIAERGDLRLILSNIEPRIRELACKHQIQPSH